MLFNVDELCESILMLLQAGKYLPSSTIRNREWRHSINNVCIHVMCLGVDEATKIVCAQSMDSRVDVSGGKRGRRLVLASMWAMNGKLGGYWFHYGDSITMFRLTPFNQGTFFPLSWDYIVCFLLFFFFFRVVGGEMNRWWCRWWWIKWGEIQFSG